MYSNDTINDDFIYIKNRLFRIDIEYEKPAYIMLKLVTENGRKTIEVMSFREFMYVYCNPEGTYVIEKLGFLFNTLDFEKEERTRCEELGIPPHVEDYYDDIPF